MIGLYSSKPNAKYRENISYHRIIMYGVALPAWPPWRHKLKFDLLPYVHIITMYRIECILYSILNKKYDIATIFLLVNDYLTSSNCPSTCPIPNPQVTSHTPQALPLEVGDLRAPKFTSWRLKHSGIGWSKMPGNKTWLQTRVSWHLHIVPWGFV